MNRWRTTVAAAAGAGLLTVATIIPVAAGGPHHGNAFDQVNMVSDIPGVAPVTDPNLINPWGMSFAPSSPLWVSDADANVSTLYAGATDGDNLSIVPLVVNIAGGGPTGQVYNPTTDWVVSSGSESGPSVFIFASETGYITGWNPSVPTPAPSTDSQVGVFKPHAVYLGLAISSGEAGHYLYAANFRTGRINVFDGSFTQLHWPGAFRDPDMPAGYMPFNIQNLRGRLYVTYAKANEEGDEEVAGPGKGFVDVYSLHGRLIERLASRGSLNAPWGLAIAPRHFGRFGGDLLVGNFGDGHISAFDRRTGEFHGQLRHADGTKIEIDGLWGLLFGNGVAGSHHTLLFSAGIAEEAHGLLGTIEVDHAR